MACCVGVASCNRRAPRDYGVRSAISCIVEVCFLRNSTPLQCLVCPARRECRSGRWRGQALPLATADNSTPKLERHAERLVHMVYRCDHLSLLLAMQHPPFPGRSRPIVLYKLKAIRPGRAFPSIATTGTPTGTPKQDQERGYATGTPCDKRCDTVRSTISQVEHNDSTIGLP